ncbi:hypothetical protein MRX96_035519 [Rhipicephalus microplus]
MQPKVGMSVAVAFVVALATVSAVGADEFVVCPLVDDKGVNATVLPNVYNCSTFYLCSQGVPELNRVIVITKTVKEVYRAVDENA